MVPFPNGEVQLLLIVMHGFGVGGVVEMPPVVDDMEQRCTHCCKHW